MTDTDWERLPGEPMKWYSRFEAYRLTGPNRSIEAVFRAESEAKQSKTKRPNPHWYEIAQKYDWKARAEAWDVSEQQRVSQEAEQYRRNLPNEFDQKYRYIYEEAVKAWLRSLEDAVIETQEITETPEVGKDEKGNLTAVAAQRLKATTRREGQSGNPALLTQAQAALKALREMFGTDAPTKLQHSWQDSLPEGYNASEVQKQFAGLLAAAAKGANANGDD